MLLTENGPRNSPRTCSLKALGCSMGCYLEQVRSALDGNLCRCEGYTTTFRAVLAYAELHGKE